MAAIASADLDEELLDPETLEDNLLISGAGENPPENEGETVLVDEGVSFDFPIVVNEKVRYYVDFFTGPTRKVFTRWLERSARYLPMMQQIFEEEGLPLDLTYLAMVESGFNNRAYSWAHAAGPWQFIASTGRIYGMHSNWWVDERRDFEKATRSAARFLRDLHVKFNGDWYLAVAAYNAGPGKIQRAIDMYETRDFWEISRGSYLALETKNYLPKLLAVLLIAKQPEKFGFIDLQHQTPLAFEVVEIPTATDLEIVAKFCEVSYDEIRDLNPELKRWCTPPGKRNYPLRIPADKKEQFEEQYSLLPVDRRINFQRHKIKKGETLNGLARRYNVQAEEILTMNKLSGPRSLRVGAELILPLRKGMSAAAIKDPTDGMSVRGKKTAYTVRSGDSLWGIARKFGVTESEIREWNRLGKSNILRPGQVLSIGSAGRSSSTPAATANTGQKTIYEIRSGDTLSKIARQFAVSVDEIRQWNGLPPDQVLRPGQKLAIHTAPRVADAQGPSPANGQATTKSKSSGTAAVKTSPAKISATQTAKTAKPTVKKIVYRVRPGDTLWNISRKFAVETHDIMGWNNLKKSHVLQPGDELTLMVEDGRKG